MSDTGPAAPAVPPLAAAAPERKRSSLKSRAGLMVTGAVIGGWVGYFASQVAVSDWDQGRRSSVDTNRGAWAAAGVLLGIGAGRLLGSGDGPAAPREPTKGRSVITHDEVLQSGAATAQQLIRSLRPEWLITRGVNSWMDSDSGERIVVYLDQARYGGSARLDEIEAANIRHVEFFDAAAATFRWGGGHAYGAIQIVLR